MSSYLNDLFSLEGKVAVVTGASRGIGAFLANALSQAGADILGVGRSNGPVGTLLDGVEYQSCDITNQANFSSICKDFYKRKGSIDILVNAAGITVPLNSNSEITGSFENIISTNLTAVYGSCISVVDFMKMGGGGSIINITSIASERAFPDNPAYVASKGGVRMLTKALALDLARFNIRVNNLAPGYIRTDMTEASYRDPLRRMERLDRMMINRWGAVDDLAGAAIYLASNSSTYVTGIDLLVDGGWIAKGL
jgi:NAD(P)-dependent dehydrogenase (short-subunit alcohol dehydrogenase family)